MSRLADGILSRNFLAAAFVFLPVTQFSLPAMADAVSVAAPQVPSFADVVTAVTPAVVSVKVESRIGGASPRDFRFDRRLEEEDDFFGERPFFRNGPRQGEARPFDRDGKRDQRQRRFGMNQGSGFFVSGDGYVVTNHHVIENGSSFTVVLDDGTELDAALVGADVRTDLAVLKVKSDRTFTYVAFSADEVRVGEWVVAVGNPFGLGGTVTAGIVSAHKRAMGSRRLDDFIQIDAAVNRGNSGGPAFNLKGQVIGVNNQILSPSGGNVGIAFAIPASTASEVVKDLIANGQVVRGWLGVEIQPVTAEIAQSVGLAEASGAIVTVPAPDSPAARAGILAGDIITSVDGEPVENPRMLARRIAAFKPDSKVRIGLWRNGEASELDVTVGKLQEAAANTRPAPEAEPVAGIGIELRIAPGGGGLLVDSVDPGGIAAGRDIRPGDVIVTVNGQAVSDNGALLRAMEAAAGEGRPSTLFQIRRGEQVRFIPVPLNRG
jgi:serine protease Do